MLYLHCCVILRAFLCLRLHLLFFFFNATATTEIYTLSLHDALPITEPKQVEAHLVTGDDLVVAERAPRPLSVFLRDRKSTRLNSSHLGISYAVFCLKKKKKQKKQ